MMLETSRLILATPQLADTTAMMNILNDIETMQNLPYLTQIGNEWTATKTQERIKKQIDTENRHEGLFFHIYDKNTHMLIGIAALPQLDFNTKTATSGIILHRAYWRKGFATEALLSVLQYCFETLHFQLIKFYVMSSNQGMRRFFEKFDLHADAAELHQAQKSDHSTTGEIVYCLSDKQWPTVKKYFLRSLKKYTPYH